MKQRTTAPTVSNEYYRGTAWGGLNKCIVINKNTGFVLPNCVGYAWGRWCESQGLKTCNLSRGNAEDWWNFRDGYQRGQTPRTGAVMCWRKGRTGYQGDGAGHVCFVEEVYPDGSVKTSESNYSGTVWFSQIRRPPYVIPGQVFQGFIYQPGGKTVEELAREVIRGEWGNGAERRRKLTEAGYDYNAVQRKVNEIMRGTK